LRSLHTVKLSRDTAVNITLRLKAPAATSLPSIISLICNRGPIGLAFFHAKVRAVLVTVQPIAARPVVLLGAGFRLWGGLLNRGWPWLRCGRFRLWAVGIGGQGYKGEDKGKVFHDDT
jgi:hypothetical protein